jgi:hypothetical protein
MFGKLLKNDLKAQYHSMSAIFFAIVIIAVGGEFVALFAKSDLGRRLYQEIALVEEEHVTHYESLMDGNATWLEMLLWHEYAECYLYWSCYKTETNRCIKALWEQNLEMEIVHLHKAAELLKKYEGKEWQEVIPCGEFPEPLSLHENIDYVRGVLKNTVQYTGDKEGYTRVEELGEDADFLSGKKSPTPRRISSLRIT